MYDEFFCMNIIHLSICLKGYTSITKQRQMRDFAASVYMWFTVIYFLSDLWRFIQNESPWWRAYSATCMMVQGNFKQNVCYYVTIRTKEVVTRANYRCCWYRSLGKSKEAAEDLLLLERRQWELDIFHSCQPYNPTFSLRQRLLRRSIIQSLSYVL